MECNTDTPSLAELKIEELLKEVRTNYPPQDAVQAVLSAIRSCFQRIPEHQVTSSLASTFVENLGVPDDKAKFTFKNPVLVDIVGSFAAQTMAKPMQTIDLSIHIPKSCFHEKDFLNHRYHAKRALYLAVLQTHLNMCSFVKSTKWRLLHHDARKPLLLVQLGSDFRPDFNFDILLVPVIGQDVFNISKLAPSRNNLKTSSEVGPEATPHYNASILEDLDMHAHCSYLKAAVSQYSGLRDTVLLLKVWMRQRGFPSMLDSLNGFLMSMLLAHLIHTGELKITGNMNALQIFRVFIETIANGRLEKGLFLNQTSSKISKEGRKEYFKFYDVVMLDPLELCNIGFRLTTSAMIEIREAASSTIAAMKGSRDFGFNDIFLTTIDFSSKFDYHLRICMKHEPSKSLSFADEDKCRDVEKQVSRILNQGLGNRVSLVRVYGRVPPSDWSLQLGTDIYRILPIFVGIAINNFETGFRMIDVGPSADNSDEAGKFRMFWGEKAELRRFKDGTISETAVWECDSMQRHLIIPKIVQHLLLRHLSLSSSDIFVSAGQLDHMLMERKKVDSSASVPYLLQAFDVLSKRVRGLEDLPLKISTIQPLHAAFRHAAVFPPNVHVLADERSLKGFSKDWVPSCADACEVMVQLEGSGRWPSNKVVIEKTKLAFCLKIAESMHRNYGIKCVAAEDSVDLLMHGFCFRLKLFYDKDPTLVQARNEINPNAKDSGNAPEANAVLPCALQNDLMLQSLHSSMLGGLHGRYPVYGPTVRLAKRWIGSHLFSDVLKEQAIELLVAYLFLRPAPYSPPLSWATGFLRFLLLLKNFDWALSPLIVDLNGDFSAKELNLIWDEFHRTRNRELSDESNLPQAAMFIAAPYDLRSRTWTAHSPNQSMLKRLVAYAKTSAQLLTKLLKGESPERWPSLFCTPLNLYDIILKIRPNKLPHPDRVLYPADVKVAVKILVKAPEDDFKPWLSRAAGTTQGMNVEKELLIGFDPTLCFIQNLKANFGDLFSYWYDHIGSNVICLNWNLSSNQESLKKRKRAEDYEKILIELGRLGVGFVESIHVAASA